MTKLNMELTEEDLKKLDFLKTVFGLTKNTEITRFCISKVFKEETTLKNIKNILKD